jgi:hypothetical protein
MTILTKTELNALNLQLFAEGGDGGTGAEGSTADSGFATTQGVKDNPLEDVKYGIQEDSVQTTDAQTTETEPTVDRNAEFEKLIKGDYKDLYDAKVQDTVQKRLKGTKEQVAKLESLSPLLEMIGNKYGVDSNDAEALIKAIEDDDSYFADEAMERGITVDELKRIRKIERENADLKKQMEEQTTRENANKLYKTWLDQSEEAKKFFPNFDLETEMQNEQFRDLLRANIDVKTAYQVIHQDEIIGGAMQYTAKTVEKKVTDKIRANGSRPVENGISSNSAAVVKTDVSQFTDADMDEIIRRVRNGEKIKL